jgi:hypothetical protein
VAERTSIGVRPQAVIDALMWTVKPGRRPSYVPSVSIMTARTPTISVINTCDVGDLQQPGIGDGLAPGTIRNDLAARTLSDRPA